MITQKMALQIAYEFIGKVQSNVDSANFTIVESKTREEPFGWVFQWNDKRYIETGNFIYALAGNQPIVVLRKTGQVQYLPTLPSKKDLNSRIAAFAEALRE